MSFKIGHHAYFLPNSSRPSVCKGPSVWEHEQTTIPDICVGSNVVIKPFVHSVLLPHKLMNTDPVDGLADGVSDAGLSCVSCETIVKSLWNGHIVDHTPSRGNQGEKNRQQKMNLKGIDHCYVVFLISKVQNDKTMK